jgi:hypothetical protein
MTLAGKAAALTPRLEPRHKAGKRLGVARQERDVEALRAEGRGHGLPGLTPVQHPHELGSTVRRQTGILTHVHPVLS